MFGAFHQLHRESAEREADEGLAGGGQIRVLDLLLRLEGDGTLHVSVPSTRPPDQISTASTFDEMSRAESILRVAGDVKWFARLLSERKTRLELVYANGKTWWTVERGQLRWPADTEFPVKVATDFIE